MFGTKQTGVRIACLAACYCPLSKCCQVSRTADTVTRKAGRTTHTIKVCDSLAYTPERNLQQSNVTVHVRRTASRRQRKRSAHETPQHTRPMRQKIGLLRLATARFIKQPTTKTCARFRQLHGQAALFPLRKQPQLPFE